MLLPISNKLTVADGKVLCESWVFLYSRGNVCALCMISAAFNVSLKQVDVSKDDNLKAKGLGGGRGGGSENMCSPVFSSPLRSARP